MEKYKKIARAVKEAFPEACEVRVVVFTSTNEKTIFEGKVRDILDSDINIESDKDLNSAIISKEMASMSFNAGIFVTDQPRK